MSIGWAGIFSSAGSHSKCGGRSDRDESDTKDCAQGRVRVEVGLVHGNCRDAIAQLLCGT